MAREEIGRLSDPLRAHIVPEILELLVDPAGVSGAPACDLIQPANAKRPETRARLQVHTFDQNEIVVLVGRE